MFGNFFLSCLSGSPDFFLGINYALHFFRDKEAVTLN